MEELLLGARVLDDGPAPLFDFRPRQGLGVVLRGMHLRRGELRARVGQVAARFLRRVHALIREVDERRGVHAGLPLRDARAGGHAEGLAAVEKLFLGAPLPADFCPCDRALQARAGQHQHELFAAVAGGEFLAADAVPQHLRQRDEAFIAHRVPVGIVDVLEVVEVEQDEGEGRAVFLRVADAGPQFTEQRRPVVEAREGVELGTLDGFFDGGFGQADLLLQRAEHGASQKAYEQPDEADVQEEQEEDLHRSHVLLVHQVEDGTEVEHLDDREHDARPSPEQKEGEVHGAPVEPVGKVPEPVSAVVVVHRHRDPSFHSCTYNLIKA